LISHFNRHGNVNKPIAEFELPSYQAKDHSAVFTIEGGGNVQGTIYVKGFMLSVKIEADGKSVLSDPGANAQTAACGTTTKQDSHACPSFNPQDCRASSVCKYDQETKTCSSSSSSSSSSTSSDGCSGHLKKRVCKADAACLWHSTDDVCITNEGPSRRSDPTVYDTWVDDDSNECYNGNDLLHSLQTGVYVGWQLFKNEFLEDLTTTITQIGLVYASANNLYNGQLNIHLIISEIIVSESENHFDFDAGDARNSNGGCLKDIGTQLDEFSDSTLLTNNGLWHFFDDCKPNSGSYTAGIAYVGVLCRAASSGRDFNVGVTYWGSETWTTFAHEIGYGARCVMV
jgi:hypothetical protein